MMPCWHRSSALLGAWAIAPLVLSAGTALAEPSAANIAVARELFAESTELRNAGKWSEAAAKLREAIAIKETAGLRFHLAHCEEQLGQLVLAVGDYDRADELIRSGAKAPDVATLLAPARAALAERLPSLLVKLPEDVTSATLSVDGTPVAATLFGKPMPVDPGSHSVEATAAGRTRFTLQVRLEEGEDRVVEATLPQAVAAEAPPVFRSEPARFDRPRNAPPVASTGARDVLLVGEGALTLGGVAVGVVFLLKRHTATERFDAANQTLGSSMGTCRGPTSADAAACEDLRTAPADRQTDGTIATVGFVGAGVSGVALALTWLLWPKARVEHAFVVAPAPGGALFRGVF